MDLQATIQSCLTALEMSSIQVEAWDCILVYMVSTKLPKIKLSLWEQSIQNKAEIPTWKELDGFLTERHRTLEAIDDVRPSGSGPVPPRSAPTSAPIRRLNSYETRVAFAPKGCDLCSGENHLARLCPRFLEMDVSGRSDYIKRKQLCLNCFARGHQQRDCTSAHSCSICHSRHHTLLHRGNPFATAPSPSASTRHQPASTPSGSGGSDEHSDVQVCFASGSGAVLLGTALINVCHLGCNFQARALIDSGSEATFITERLFNLIKLPFKTIQAQTPALISPFLRSLPNYGLPDIPLADPKFFESSQIDVLIGADILPSILLGNFKTNICGSLLEQENIFGWVLTGPLSPATPRSVSAFSTRVVCSHDDSLDQLLTKFWEVKESPTRIVPEADEVCERNFVQTTLRYEGGKYVVPLPLRDPDHMVINSSSPSANGTSLNDILYAGPVLQSDLTIQILKWRYFKFVFNADIEKM
ncbi:hypothetical protein KR038_009259, partial [Drosophila bunnanda]